MLTKQDVVKAIMGWSGLYEMPSGEKFFGSPVSEVPSQLRDARWKNVSRIERSDLRKMGLEVVEARYVGGVRPKRFCQVVVATRELSPCRGARRCQIISSDWEDFALQLMGVS